MIFTMTLMILIMIAIQCFMMITIMTINHPYATVIMMAIIVYTNNNDNDKKHDNNYYNYMRPGQNCMGMGQTYSKIESIITLLPYLGNTHPLTSYFRVHRVLGFCLIAICIIIMIPSCILT